MNLNKISIYKDEVYPRNSGYYEQEDFSIIDEKSNIEVFFKNIENNIINKIKKYKNVIGCVAWLTNENILKELAKKDNVIIIIQEEDFLRPDNNFDGNKLNWKNKLYKLYKNIEINKKNNINLGSFGINYNGHVGSGIMRLGMVNIDKMSAFPRMHNKFIICFNDTEPYQNEGYEYENYDHDYTELSISEIEQIIDCKNQVNQKSLLYPNMFLPINNSNINFENFSIQEPKGLDGELLTGSYNYTENSNNSLENVICIKDQKIIKAYFKQFCELSSITVPLDWEGEWSPHHNSDMRYGS